MKVVWMEQAEEALNNTTIISMASLARKRQKGYSERFITWAVCLSPTLIWVR